MSTFGRSIALTIAAAAVSALPVMAQSIVPTGQARFISGSSSSTTPDGTTNTGLLREEAPEGDFFGWTGMLAVPGFIAGTGTQDGGFNGTDTIVLNSFAMNLGGGNAPGTSAESQMRNEFTYTFNVGNGAQYTFDLNIGCAGPGGPPNTTNDWSLTAFLSGSGGDEFRFETGPQTGYTLAVQGLTGTLSAGSYTLSLVGLGSVSFIAIDSGNGQGGGVGGNTPVMTFHVEGGEFPSCLADLGQVGGVPGTDGVLDNNDFVVFIDYFFAQDARADRGSTGGVPGADGAWDNNDFVVFIDQFFAGC
ncbi:MAG TPA: GC-type dockerin domain-anchored protein [Phycisphaerales bacterium]|nr:GC-type dockerin domain-anchored protein [Phycisphaerales bacterium]